MTNRVTLRSGQRRIALASGQRRVTLRSSRAPVRNAAAGASVSGGSAIGGTLVEGSGSGASLSGGSALGNIQLSVPASGASVSAGAATATLIRPPANVFGAALTIEYDPARGYTLADGNTTVSSLACQRSGLTVSASGAGNNCVYTAADADFGGKPSFTTSSAGSDGLFSATAHGSDLIASGASPYIAWLGKLGTLNNSRRIWTLYSDSSLTNPFTSLQAVAGVLQTIVNGTTVDLNTPNTSVHLFEFVYNGGNLDFYMDNVLIESNATAAYVLPVRKVAFGCRGDNTGFLDAKHAYLIATSSAPADIATKRADMLPFWRARGAAV